MKSIAAVATLFSVLTVSAGDVQAAHGNRTDRSHGNRIEGSAHQLKRQAAEFRRQLHGNLRNSPSYRHLDQHAHEIYDQAAHIHSGAHRSERLLHIERDARKLDAMIDSVQRELNVLRRSAQYNRYPNRRYVSVGHGVRTGIRAPGRPLNRLSALANDMEQTVRALRTAIRYRAPRRGPVYHKPNSARPVYPVVPVVRPVRARPYQRFGMNTSGVSFSITLR